MAEQVIPKPGLFASATERRFRDGLVAYLQQNWNEAARAFELASGADARNLSDDFLLGTAYVRLERFAEAAKSFEKVVASPTGLPDDLMRRYVPGTLEMQLPVTDRVTVGVGFNSIGATLILTELYQELGRRPEAIGLLQRLLKALPDDDVVRLSLADLLYDDNDFAGLLELTQGVESRDDVTLATLHLRAKALANEGLMQPAAELLSAALRRTAAAIRSSSRRFDTTAPRPTSSWAIGARPRPTGPSWWHRIPSTGTHGRDSGPSHEASPDTETSSSGLQSAAAAAARKDRRSTLARVLGQVA